MSGFEEEIRAIIANAACNYTPDSTTAAFIEKFREIYGENLKAVIYYGSRLVEGLSKPSSFRDFFVLVDSYEPLAKSRFDRLVLPLMPPNLWFLTLNEGDSPQDSKYHLLTLADFLKYCSRRAPDHYVIGRMSKRTALLWFSDEPTREATLKALGDAFLNNARRALPLLSEPADYETTVKHFLAFSYKSELRLETADKIDQLYRTGKRYYDPLYRLLLELLAREGALLRNGDYYVASPTEVRKEFGTRLYILKSKLRHMSRFPFMIRNMDNWLEQLLGKYERTFGKPLELSDFERRHRFYTAVKYFYRIKIAKSP